MEEDFFHLLIAPPAPAGAPAPPHRLSLAGGRILAGQLRAAVAQQHALAVTQVGQSQACPFDLHALVPVPPAMLQRCNAVRTIRRHWLGCGSTGARPRRCAT
jgi:hypothetical protein